MTVPENVLCIVRLGMVKTIPYDANVDIATPYMGIVVPLRDSSYI